MRWWITRSDPGPDQRRPRSGRSPPGWPPRRAAGSWSRRSAPPPPRSAAARSPAVPMPSQTGWSSSVLSPTPSSARARPISAAKSSSSTTGSSGTLARRMNCDPAGVALELARLVRSRCGRTSDSSPIATTSTPIAISRRVQVVRVGDLVDALVQREQPADAEQHQRDQEAVDVAVPAEAERVLRRGLPPGPLAAEQQQPLVARVGQRVHRLGQHRGRAGEQERDELDHRDAEVGRQRGQHRPRPPPALIGRPVDASRGDVNAASSPSRGADGSTPRARAR